MQQLKIRFETPFQTEFSKSAVHRCTCMRC